MLDLQQLSDRLEIQDLLVAYATAIDTLDLDSLDQVFSEDAYVDYRAFGGIAGTRTEVKNWLSEVLPTMSASQLLIGNADIRVDGDKATGRVMCLTRYSSRSPARTERPL